MAPFGVVETISAFNFPVAVWAWNSMLAWVCGDVCIWKPSKKKPLTAINGKKLFVKVFETNDGTAGICGLVIGDATLGKIMAEDSRIALISATGSTRMVNLSPLP